MKRMLYVVGKVVGKADWEIQGVFDSKEKAEKGCIKSNYFVGPIEANILLPDEKIEWPGAYFPQLKEGK